ncbi:chemotaxis protein CheX [Bacillus sp. OV322]|uniref:chemotaxis protein CheX n=1 Tax=Bacillus sp. OV322 TaxID=1882764 RepID=UPI0008E9829C|nr:chemotaxis protein CheX [Bacillus sp. OV322]SFC46310.1 chemotaxis protein CheX [Bacillus sp. OV322]
MAVTAHAASVLNGTISAVKSVIPAGISFGDPFLLRQPLEQASLSVLIGMTGDVRGRLIIEANEEIMSKIAELMFGMPLQGEMLESFSAELGNMIAGNLATHTAASSMEMDITPPTVLIGTTKMYGFEKAIVLPVSIEQTGSLDIVLIIETEETA